MFECVYCFKTFTHRGNLNTHVARHGIPKFKCSQCLKAFHTKYDLKRHETLLHSVVYNPQICPECGAMMRSKQGLNSHITAVHEKKKFTCEICAKEFKQKGNLTRHRKLHSAEKEECRGCRKKFARLCEHSKLCSNPFRQSVHGCKECGAMFKEKRYLTEHMKYKHTASRYTCVRCDAVFSHRKTLRDHRKKCAQ